MSPAPLHWGRPKHCLLPAAIASAGRHWPLELPTAVKQYCRLLPTLFHCHLQVLQRYPTALLWAVQVVRWGPPMLLRCCCCLQPLMLASQLCCCCCQLVCLELDLFRPGLHQSLDLLLLLLLPLLLAQDHLQHLLLELPLMLHHCCCHQVFPDLLRQWQCRPLDLLLLLLLPLLLAQDYLQHLLLEFRNQHWLPHQLRSVLGCPHRCHPQVQANHHLPQLPQLWGLSLRLQQQRQGLPVCWHLSRGLQQLQLGPQQLQCHWPQCRRCQHQLQARRQLPLWHWENFLAMLLQCLLLHLLQFQQKDQLVQDHPMQVQLLRGG
ncbi:hypothetical protein COO60DRAFT_1518011 [Scenedesmus sp. NREL 46B-D3]|nr:hypothetical protein COO60DRAFT_1518011 [Scenedesmus sp. NREL 46B-D3]